MLLVLTYSISLLYSPTVLKNKLLKGFWITYQPGPDTALTLCENNSQCLNGKSNEPIKEAIVNNLSTFSNNKSAADDFISLLPQTRQSLHF